MKQPDTGEYRTGDIQVFREHQSKSEAHQKRDHYHYLYFCSPCHAFACDKRFEVVFIQLRANEPFV